MKKNGSVLWLSAVIVLFGIFGNFAKIMTSLDHNEHMYITAGVLFSQNQMIYKDFAYLQTPYLPLLYGSIYRLLGIQSYYLLTGKLFSFLFLTISALVLFLLSRRVISDIDSSLCVVALFLLNTTIVIPATESSNYIMPLAFSFISFYIFDASINKGNVDSLRIAISGLLLAIAVGTKLTYATVIFSFLITIFYYPLINKNPALGIKEGILYIMLPFITGLLVGLLPILFFLQQDLEVFVFNNLGYHKINTQWRQMTGYAGPMSLFSKIAYAYGIFLNLENLIVMIGILFGAVRTINSIETIRQLPIGAHLAFVLFLFAAPAAIAPTPSFLQYYAAPISFLFLLLVYFWTSNVRETSTLYRKLLFVLVLATLAHNGLSLLNSVSILVYRDKWIGLHVHDVSMNIRNTLIDNQIDTNHKVATLSPLYVIEANLPIYNELSTGPFLYRIGDLLTTEQRKRFVGTSPKSIGNLLSVDPPSAIIVGYEGQLDEPLVEYARSKGYREIYILGFDGKIYIRP